MTDELDPRRHLELEGTFNTRDVGGYATRDGRQTRWGQFLRSDSLHELSAADQLRLLDYGIRTVIDLRRSREMQAQVNVFFGSDKVTYYHQNMAGDMPLREHQGCPEGLEEIERKRWGYSVVLDKRQSEVRDTLCTLAAPDSLPALVHCAGGADRTGIISALVLGIAGVPAENRTGLRPHGPFPLSPLPGEPSGEPSGDRPCQLYLAGFRARYALARSDAGRAPRPGRAALRRGGLCVTHWPQPG